MSAANDSRAWTVLELDGPLAGATVPLLDDPNDMVAWAFDTWILPEVTRRQERGRAPKPLELRAAQVVLNVAKPPEVRLNGEVRATMIARATRAIAAGEDVYEDDFDEVSGMELTGTDANAAHLTVILHKGRWVGSFDFRYNAARISAHLAAADDFLANAEAALAHGRSRPFVEDLWSATELVAKAWLMTLPLRELLKTPSHKFVDGLYEWWGSLGNTPPEYPELLKRLNKLRRPARYLQGALALDDVAAAELLATAKRMREDVDEHVPREPTRRAVGGDAAD